MVETPKKSPTAKPEHKPHESPDWRKESEPNPAGPPPQPQPGDEDQPALKMPVKSPLGPGTRAAPVPPAGYTQTRTMTVAVWTASGKAPMYYLTEGSYNAFHGSATGVRQDVLNRLSPPPALAGAG